ncbi:MAG: cell division protein FtsW [Armatimonadota bacterium]|nr:MAG: cell division protein FtsW [Armatimonadota bacterium]
MTNMRPAKEDRVLTGAVLLLVIIGLIVVYDASFPKQGFSQLMKQTIWAGAGLVAYMVGRRFPLLWLHKGAGAFAFVSMMLMLAVLTPLGVERNGAVRWLKLGQIGALEILVQPSELGKIALIVLLARLLCAPNMVGSCENVRGRNYLWALFSILATAGVVVAVQEDLGTALVFVGIGVGMLFAAGLPFRRVALLVALLAVACVLFIFQKEYRIRRVVAFTQPFAYMHTTGYQLAHSLMGIGSGGIWGTGLGLGRAKEFLPAAETDFVFATVAEETGVFGSTALIALLALVSWRIFLVAHRAQAMFLLLLASGVGLMIALQSLLNLYVVTGAVPTTGVPLPFISYGGSSLVTLLFSIGLVQKIASNPVLERVKEVSHARAAGRRGNGRSSVPRREYRRGVA